MGGTLSVTPDNRNLGSLPKADRNSALQRRSAQAFTAAFPTEQFILRDERSEDYGVDASLEVLIDSQATNLRSQVQLKSTGSGRINQDGSISLSIDTINLKYLLNGLSPLYILYIAPANELRFAWAHDERKRLDKENPEWMQQATITIRFREVLTPDAINQIYERVLREGRMRRNISDVLSRASFNEHVGININAETLEIIDPDESKEVLLRSGATIVAAGYASLVIKGIQSLRDVDSQLPRIQTIQAYAHHSLCDYQQALACTGKALLRQNELSASDKQLLNDIRNACRYEIGQISYSEYVRLLESELSSQSDDDLSFTRKLNCVRLAFQRESNMEIRQKLLSEFRSTVAEILSAANISDNSKLYARIILLEAEGQLLTSQYLQMLLQSRIRQALGTISVFEIWKLIQNRTEESVQWLRKITAAAKEAQERKHPLLIANALAVEASITTGHLANGYIFSLRSGTEINVPGSSIQPVMGMVTLAMEIYQQAGQLEGDLRTRLLLADLFLLAKQPEAAKRLAEGVYPKAQAMDYVVLTQWAQNHLSEETPLHKIQNLATSIATATDGEWDEKMAASSDEDMRSFALDMLKALNLSEDRLSVIERETISLRTMARERLSWCRHIEIIQNLNHTRQKETYYLTDPQRFCVCLKHRYESAIGHTDTDSLVLAFKQAYCHGCADRDPISAKL